MFKIFIAVGKSIVSVIRVLFTKHFVKILQASLNFGLNAISLAKLETELEDKEKFAFAVNAFKTMWVKEFTVESKDFLAELITLLAYGVDKLKNNPSYFKDIASTVEDATVSLKKVSTARKRRR